MIKIYDVIKVLTRTVNKILDNNEDIRHLN